MQTAKAIASVWLASLVAVALRQTFKVSVRLPQSFSLCGLAARPTLGCLAYCSTARLQSSRHNLQRSHTLHDMLHQFDTFAACP